jgi:hypothetical protein
MPSPKLWSTRRMTRNPTLTKSLSRLRRISFELGRFGTISAPPWSGFRRTVRPLEWRSPSQCRKSPTARIKAMPRVWRQSSANSAGIHISSRSSASPPETYWTSATGCRPALSSSAIHQSQPVGRLWLSLLPIQRRRHESGTCLSDPMQMPR